MGLSKDASKLEELKLKEVKNGRWDKDINYRISYGIWVCSNLHMNDSSGYSTLPHTLLVEFSNGVVFHQYSPPQESTNEYSCPHVALLSLCRLAMVAFVGFLGQHAATGKSPIVALTDHVANPWVSVCLCVPPLGGSDGVFPGTCKETYHNFQCCLSDQILGMQQR